MSHPATAIVDTLYLVPRDTLVISHPDTLVATLQQAHRTPSDWFLAIIPAALSLASFIAVIWGWRVAHRNAIKQQNVHLRRQVIHTACQEVSNALERYSRWLLLQSSNMDALYVDHALSPPAFNTLRNTVGRDEGTEWLEVVHGHAPILKRPLPELAKEATPIAQRHIASRELAQRAVLDQTLPIAVREQAAANASAAYSTLSMAVLTWRDSILDRVYGNLFDEKGGAP